MNTFVTARMLRVAVAIGSSGAVVTGILAAAAAPADAGTLACGDLITSNVTLHHNLDCSADTTSNGLNIGKSGVTVNLNGHKIIGPGYAADTYGVFDGFSNVKIENGTIANFEAGVTIEGTSGSPLTHVTIQHLALTSNAPQEGYGLYAEYTDGARITDLSASDLYEAMDLYGVTGSLVAGNRIQASAIGIYDEDGSGNLIAGNKISATTDTGIDTFDTNGETIKGNSVSGSGAYGIYCDDAIGMHIIGNSLNHLYTGVEMYFSTDSLVSHNRGTADTWGGYTYEGKSLAFIANNFQHGQFGLEADFPVGVGFKGNVTDHNSVTGTYIWDGGSTSSSYQALLVKNSGNDNRFGLYSQFQTSGYGNHATGNKVIDCFNVSCVQPHHKNKKKNKNKNKHSERNAPVMALPSHRVPKTPAKPKAMPKR